MTVYMCDIYEIKKYAQVKAILAFTIESVSSCFLINYIFAIHAIVVKLDDVRKRNRSVHWILSNTHQYIAQSGSFENTTWNDSFKWSMVLILWPLSILSCFALSSKWLFCKTTWYLVLAYIIWMPTLHTKWLQFQNTVIDTRNYLQFWWE